ncbi:MAG: short-chain dehydrogenase [Planctomycetaceae bacterium]
MRHDLVVGGTGMLRGLSLHLAATLPAVSVVARAGPRLADLAAAAPAIRPVAVDWREDAALRTALRDATAAAGPFDLVVAWIHSSAPAAPLIVAAAAARPGDPVPFHQLFGSGGDASQPIQLTWRRRLRAMQGIDYRRVVLGRMGARWLRDAEIAAGVIAAVEAGASHHEVGEVG